MACPDEQGKVEPMRMQGRLPVSVAALVGRGHERAKVADLVAHSGRA